MVRSSKTQAILENAQDVTYDLLFEQDGRKVVLFIIPEDTMGHSFRAYANGMIKTLLTSFKKGDKTIFIVDISKSEALKFRNLIKAGNSITVVGRDIQEGFKRLGKPHLILITIDENASVPIGLSQIAGNMLASSIRNFVKTVTSVFGGSAKVVHIVGTKNDAIEKAKEIIDTSKNKISA